MNQSDKKNLEFIQNAGVSYFLQDSPRNWFENTKNNPKKENFNSGYLIFDCAAPSTTISGALSPPIASNDKCIDFVKNNSNKN